MAFWKHSRSTQREIRSSIRSSPNADGSVLAGSDDGLVGLRSGKVQRMTTRNGLPCDFVIVFHSGQGETLVALHRCGIVELLRFRAPTVVDQSGRDGAELAFTTNWMELRPGRSELSTQRHTLRMGACGLPAELSYRWWIRPDSRNKRYLQRHTSNRLIVDRKEFEATHNLKLSPNPRDLQIDYTSPTFSIPQKVNFRYRLDGYDRDWHEAGTRRQAFYTDLPPGKYFVPRDRIQ